VDARGLDSVFNPKDRLVFRPTKGRTGTDGVLLRLKPSLHQPKDQSESCMLLGIVA
jgi:hypothetical protein